MNNRVGTEVNDNTKQFRQKPRTIFAKLRLKVVDSWYRSQVGHRSQYSIERSLAFRDYHLRVSTVRAVAICFFTPIPALFVALISDCFPLAPPSNGWQGNYMVWIRLIFSMFFVSLGLVFQVQGVIVARTISGFGMFGIAFGSSIVYVMASIAVAAAWKFPIPFGYVLMVGPYVVIFSTFLVSVIGPRALLQSPVLREQIKSQMMIIATQGLVAVAYPTFSAVFNRLSGTDQTAFLLVMPIIKFVTKQMIANTAGKLHEYVGPIVVFSVDVFNVYYVAICMQAATSTLTTLIIIGSDSFHVVLAVRDIFRRANGARSYRGMNESTDSERRDYFLQDLPSLLRGVYRKNDPFQGTRKNIRIRAPFPLQLSVESALLLKEILGTSQGLIAPRDANPLHQPLNSPNKRIQGIPVRAGILSSITRVLLSRTRLRTKIFGIGAMPYQKTLSTLPSTPKISRDLPDDKALYNVLRTLFHSEYVLMAEYIEFMLPMLYALYLTAIYHLPIAAYYPHTRAMTSEKLKRTVENILIFSGIEFSAFLGLLVVLKQKLGYSPLSQLAFVLETQFRSVHGHLFVWNLYILHLTLVHFGVDLDAPFMNQHQ